MSNEPLPSQPTNQRQALGLAFGLRGRILAALVLVSAITLVVAFAALLSPLDARLRSDSLKNLEVALRSNKPQLDSIVAAADRGSQEQLRRATRRLSLRLEATIVVVDGSGKVVSPNELLSNLDLSLVTQARRTGVQQRRTTGSSERAVAEVATPIRYGNDRGVVLVRKSLVDLSGAVQVVSRAALFGAIAGLLCAVILAAALAWRLAARLRSLRDKALAIAEDPLSDDVTFEPGTDEVGALSGALATMHAKLSEQEEIRRAFVANASHELRTPLSSLRLTLDLLESNLSSEEIDVSSARKDLKRADTQAERLGRLAAQLLQLSSVDAGVELETEPLELDVLLGQVIAEFTGAEPSGSKEISFKSGGMFWVSGHSGSIAQIVRALVDNSFRHAAGSPVSVRTELRGDSAAVLVHDDGPGIDVAESEAIFERFRRGSSAGAGGFGLGLAIARDLARGMGGDLALIPGAGATFELRLPLDIQQKPASA